MACQRSTQQTAPVEDQPSDCSASPSRGRPLSLGWLRSAMRVETAKELAWRLAIDPELSRLDDKRLQRFTREVQDIILSARGKLRDYLPGVLRREPINSPLPSGLSQKPMSLADQSKLEDWRERVFGASADRPELYDSDGHFGMKVSVPVLDHVAGVFGRIEKVIAKEDGVTDKTLRNWANRAIEEGLINPRRLLIGIDRDGHFVFSGPSGKLRAQVGLDDEGRYIYELCRTSDGPRERPKRWSRR
jgi:hypothetical protein